MSRQVKGHRPTAAAPSCFTECLYRLQSHARRGLAWQYPSKVVLPTRMRRQATSVQAGVCCIVKMGRDAKNIVAVCGQFGQRLERQFQQWQREQQQPQQHQLCSVGALVRPCPSVETSW